MTESVDLVTVAKCNGPRGRDLYIAAGKVNHDGITAKKRRIV